MWSPIITAFGTVVGAAGKWGRVKSKDGRTDVLLISQRFFFFCFGTPPLLPLPAGISFRAIADRFGANFWEMKGRN